MKNATPAENIARTEQIIADLIAHHEANPPKVVVMTEPKKITRRDFLRGRGF